MGVAKDYSVHVWGSRISGGDVSGLPLKGFVNVVDSEPTNTYLFNLGHHFQYWDDDLFTRNGSRAYLGNIRRIEDTDFSNVQFFAASSDTSDGIGTYALLRKDRSTEVWGDVNCISNKVKKIRPILKYSGDFILLSNSNEASICTNEGLKSFSPYTKEIVSFTRQLVGLGEDGNIYQFARVRGSSQSPDTQFHAGDYSYYLSKWDKGIEGIHIDTVYAGRSSLTVIDNTGKVYTKYHTEDFELQVDLSLNDVAQVTTTDTGFAGLKNDGTVVYWTSQEPDPLEIDFTPMPSDLSSVAHIASTFTTHAALTTEGKVAAWGINRDGSNDVPAAAQSEVKKLVASNGAFSVLKNTGIVVSWSDAVTGGDNNLVENELVNIVNLEGIAGGFIAVRQDGEVFSWGNLPSQEPVELPAGLKTY